MSSILREQRNWRDEWLERTAQRMEELERSGEEKVTLHIREFQHILLQLLAANKRGDRLEEVLCLYARCAIPMPQIIEPPAMFGGDTKSKP